MYPFEGFGRPVQARERLPRAGQISSSPPSARGGQQKPPETASGRRPAAGSRTSGAVTPRRSRWECRLVTPMLGASLDCCQGEGCGMVMCEQPCSFFGDYCCAVHHPNEPEKAVDIPASQEPAATAGRKKEPFFSSRESRHTVISRSSPVSEQAKKWRSGQSGGIRIFVGTWNTEYQEIPAEYLASLQDRRPSSPTSSSSSSSSSKRCYTAQQLHASYTRHNIGGIASGRAGLEEGSDTLSPQQDLTRTSIGSPGASTTATTTASFAGMGAETALVCRGEPSHPTEVVPAEARWRHMAAAAAGIAAAGAAAAGAAGGAAAVAAARAAAAAGAALSTGKAVDVKPAVCGNENQDGLDQNLDYDDEEAGEEVEVDENKRSAIAKLFVLSSRGPEPLTDWLKPGYDVYVITLQEVISMSSSYNTAHP